MDAYELVRSVETVLAVWLVSSLIVAVWTIRMFSRLSWKRVRALPGDQSGAGYSLSYVMTIPFYLVFLLLVIETTFALVAKVGTVYAAYAGARTAIVWSSSTTPADAKARTVAAARQAMVPFATGKFGGGASTARQRGLLDIYGRRTSRPHSTAYVASKIAYAEKTAVVTDVPESGKPSWWDRDIQVAVTYPFRFHVSSIGRALGERGADGSYTLPIQSIIGLQSEAPQNIDQSLGIRYASPN